MIVDSLTYCQKEKGLKIYAWCIMSSHIHLIVRRDGKQSLSKIIRDFKKFTSKKIIELIEKVNESRREWMLGAFNRAADKIKRNVNYKVWQDGNPALPAGRHPILLDTNKMMEQRLDYLPRRQAGIHNNPVEARIVDEPEHYVFSSARNYAGGKGLLEVEFIE